MRWKGRRGSNNIEDRRGQRTPVGFGRGRGLLQIVPVIYRMLGLKWTAALGAVGLVFLYFTGNIGLLTGVQSPVTASSSSARNATPQEQELVDFVGVVLADTEETWSHIFSSQGKVYKKPTLVLFKKAVRSACGTAQSAVGPFYCPADQQVYIDLSFFRELETRFNAPGDFAQAYVIAHEIGHHVQTLQGVSGKVRSSGVGLNQVEKNRLSVLQELQADCYAGIWAYHAQEYRQILEEGDIEEGIAAAAAIGDDALQHQAGGAVRPDSFTHGSSEQRVQWFKQGFEAGEIQACDTFKAAS